MPLRGLYATTLITEKDVIPAKAGIQENTGFRVKPGMTNHTGPIYHHMYNTLVYLRNNVLSNIIVDR